MRYIQSMRWDANGCKGCRGLVTRVKVDALLTSYRFEPTAINAETFELPRHVPETSVLDIVLHHSTALRRDRAGLAILSARRMRNVLSWCPAGHNSIIR